MINFIKLTCDNKPKSCYGWKSKSGFEEQRQMLKELNFWNIHMNKPALIHNVTYKWEMGWKIKNK